MLIRGLRPANADLMAKMAQEPCRRSPCQRNSARGQAVRIPAAPAMHPAMWNNAPPAATVPRNLRATASAMIVPPTPARMAERAKAGSAGYIFLARARWKSPLLRTVVGRPPQHNRSRGKRGCAPRFPPRADFDPCLHANRSSAAGFFAIATARKPPPRCGLVDFRSIRIERSRRRDG